MRSFTPTELAEIEAQWRAVPDGHAWTGVSWTGEAPGEVWLFRVRANWRHLPLRAVGEGYLLSDETGREAYVLASLADLADAIAEISALAPPASAPGAVVAGV
jgi:hypothetical protein